MLNFYCLTNAYLENIILFKPNIIQLKLIVLILIICESI